MKIKFVRKWAYPLFFSKVPVYVNGEVIAKVKNKGKFDYEGPARTIKLHGPGVVRNIEFDLETDEHDLVIEFKIAMGVFAGGFLVKILCNGEEVQKIRKTF